MTMQDLMAMTGASDQTVHRWIVRDGMPTRERIGRAWDLDPKDVRKWAGNTPAFDKGQQQIRQQIVDGCTAMLATEPEPARVSRHKVLCAALLRLEAEKAGTRA